MQIPTAVHKLCPEKGKVGVHMSALFSSHYLSLTDSNNHVWSVGDFMYVVTISYKQHFMMFGNDSCSLIPGD